MCPLKSFPSFCLENSTRQTAWSPRSRQRASRANAMLRPRRPDTGTRTPECVSLHRRLLPGEVVMNTRNMAENPVNRRSFLGGAATLAACAIMPRGVLGADAAKPNSVFNGVRIGCITYSYRGEIDSAEDTLKALIEDGLSEVELMDGPIRSYAGMGGGGRRGARQQPAEPTDEQRQAQLARCARAAQDVQRRGRQHPHPQDPLRPVGRGDRLQLPGGQGAGLRRPSPWSARSRWPRSSRPSPTSTRSGSASTTTRTTTR